MALHDELVAVWARLEAGGPAGFAASAAPGGALWELTARSIRRFEGGLGEPAEAPLLRRAVATELPPTGGLRTSVEAAQG